jgi:hypothetical protein
MQNFIDTNVAFDKFQGNVQAQDAARRQEELDFRARKQYEDQVAGDKALRAGIGDYYAKQAQVTAAPAVQPAPVQAPVVRSAPAPVVSPAPVNQPDYGDVPSRSAPAPNVVPQSTDVPASAAISTVVPRGVRQSQPQASPYQPIIAELAKAPGTGTAMAGMMQHDMTQQAAARAEDRRLREEGSRLMLGALKDGDVELAKYTAQQYGLNVPDEMWSNKNVVMQLRTAGNLAKQLSIKDEHAVAFAHGYVEALAAGAPVQQAVMQGLAKVPKNGFEVKGHVVAEDGTVTFYDKNGETKDSGIKARPTGGRGGAGSVYEVKRNAWLAVHPGDQQGALDYASGKKQIPPEQIVNWVEAAVRGEERNVPGGYSPQERDERRNFFKMAFTAANPARTATPGAPAQAQDAPRDAAQRQVGTVYNTPKGQLKWMGDGWERP